MLGLIFWCTGEDLNFHDRNDHQPLKLTRLPISPPVHTTNSESTAMDYSEFRVFCKPYLNEQSSEVRLHNDLPRQPIARLGELHLRFRWKRTRVLAGRVPELEHPPAIALQTVCTWHCAAQAPAWNEHSPNLRQRPYLNSS